ncbi:recombinase family protein [Robertmurraya korlensis]|uniref:recombinase family protein n=1 Tax=Robertmurraya korlensis TaxID=519977 RepID=UPI00203F5828|nr:recombinase family protein [Robertmurraya korlensis]MCM3603197.1 recombinase family protein [Robertmurraya korlensis]
MAKKRFAYIRVSDKDQNEARQVETMKREGIEERDVFIEKMSGKNFERPKYQLLKQLVREGDEIVFDSITRMGRSMNETLKEYEWFVENGVELKFIKEPMINTSNEQDDIIKQAIQRVILTVLAAFAEKERLDIKIRQAEGIEAAKAKGKHLGRPKAVITPEFELAYKQWFNKEITAVEAMKRSNVSKTTFYRLVKQLKEKDERHYNIR